MEEGEKLINDVDSDDLEKLSKSGIPRPLSRGITRPASKPSPSARVHALNKEDIEDIDQHSGDEDDEEDEDEEDDDEDQGIHIEGAQLFSRAKRLSFHNWQQICDRRSSMLYSSKRESLLPYRKTNVTIPRYIEQNVSPEYNLCNEYYDENTLNIVQEERDQSYLCLKFSHKRAYDPADFESLPVSKDMKEVFQFITRYTPQNIDLDTKLRPFIPEFIPAVGDIDAFIKVTRPDNVVDKLGLVELDEPCAKQTDPTVLDLQLRAISKETTFKSVAVKSLENADKNPKEIDAWIDSLSNLHRSKPPPTVHYSRNMPDIDTLMQEWPAEFEETINEVGIPPADLDCSLEDYVELICGLMDIPVYRSKVQSLHVLFSLFLEFRSSQHFRSLIMSNEMGNGRQELNREADCLIIRND